MSIRQQLRRGEGSIEKVTEYLDLVRQYFQIQYQDFPYEQIGSPGLDEFARIEMERRINNVVYAASLFLEAKGDITTLAPHFSREHLERLTGYIHQRGIEEVETDQIVHTIGFAYFVLGNASSALSAGDRLMRLIYDRGWAISARPEIVGYIEDALQWRRAADPGYAFKNQAVS